jgi:hypothetical membrane protein
VTRDIVRSTKAAIICEHYLGVAQMWSGVLAPALIVFAVLLASLFAKQYSHLDDSICQLGAQDRPEAWLMTLGFLIYAGLVSLFASHLRRELDSNWGRTAAKAMLLHAAYALLLAFVQANPKISGGEPNGEGAIHIFLARGSMVFVWLAMVSVAKHYGRSGRNAVSTYSILAIGIGLAMAVLYVGQFAVQIDGIFERVMLLSVLGWFVLLTLHLREDKKGRAVSSRAEPGRVDWHVSNEAARMRNDDISA